MLTRLLTTTRVRLLILVALATSLVVIGMARRAHVIVDDAIDIDIAEPSHDIVVQDVAVVGDELPPELRVTTSHHRVTRLGRAPACGILYAVSTVEYDDVTLIVPCMEFLTGRGLRFAIGDEHVFEAIPSRLLSIIANGTRYDVAPPVVVAPHDVFGHLDYTFDGTLHYRAPGFRYDER